MPSTVAINGLSILLKFAVFMGDFYLSLFLLWGTLVMAGLLFLGRRVFKLIVLIREAFMLSFATASSEAAHPKILDALDRFGVRRKISSFVMPMGYSFNLDGSMMYCTFASLFIAQAYDIHLSLGTQVTMLLVLMLTSKGMAGVRLSGARLVEARRQHHRGGVARRRTEQLRRIDAVAGSDRPPRQRADAALARCEQPPLLVAVVAGTRVAP